MIRKCESRDKEGIYSIINDAARAYEGVIPEDRWKVPYMSREELNQEIENEVRFWCYKKDGELLGVMGLQSVADVTLIRHAYVLTSYQRRGIGGKLLRELLKKADCPMLVGTWADATWAVRFYEKHGFRLVSASDKNRLLRKYWAIPERQIETSVVLADKKWFAVGKREDKSNSRA